MNVFKHLPLYVRVLPFYIMISLTFIYPTLTASKAQAVTPIMTHGVQPSAAKQSQQTMIISGTPKRITIPRLDIDLPVQNALYNYKTNVWSITDHTANYATSSALPNNTRGKSFIYGHWSSDVFGPTRDLVAGDIAYIYTDNDHIFSYTYTHKITITPYDTEILQTLQGKPGVVLMTCEGTFAQNRRMMYFDLREYK